MIGLTLSEIKDDTPASIEYFDYVDKIRILFTIYNRFCKCAFGNLASSLSRISLHI